MRPQRRVAGAGHRPRRHGCGRVRRAGAHRRCHKSVKDRCCCPLVHVLREVAKGPSDKRLFKPHRIVRRAGSGEIRRVDDCGIGLVRGGDVSRPEPRGASPRFATLNSVVIAGLGQCGLDDRGRDVQLLVARQQRAERGDVVIGRLLDVVRRMVDEHEVQRVDDGPSRAELAHRRRAVAGKGLEPVRGGGEEHCARPRHRPRTDAI